MGGVYLGEALLKLRGALVYEGGDSFTAVWVVKVFDELLFFQFEMCIKGLVACLVDQLFYASQDVRCTRIQILGQFEGRLECLLRWRRMADDP